MLDPYYEYSYDHPGPPSRWQTVAGPYLCIPFPIQQQQHSLFSQASWGRLSNAVQISNICLVMEIL